MKKSKCCKAPYSQEWFGKLLYICCSKCKRPFEFIGEIFLDRESRIKGGYNDN